MMLLTTLVAAFFLVSTTCVKLDSIVVPHTPVVGEPVVLECPFDLEREALHSVSWYRDNIEFFRYVPNSNPRVTVFKGPGLDIDVAASTDKTVHLRPVTLDTSGAFKCEVTSNSKTSPTVAKTANMLVFDEETSTAVTGGIDTVMAQPLLLLPLVLLGWCLIAFDALPFVQV